MDTTTQAPVTAGGENRIPTGRNGATQAPARSPLAGLRSMSWSAYEALSRCASEYDLAYNQQVVSMDYPAALALGSAFHDARERLCTGQSLAAALAAADAAIIDRYERACLDTDHYAPGSEARADIDRQVSRDRQKAHAIVTAYFEHWFEVDADGVTIDRGYIYEATEIAFERRLENPKTNALSRGFRHPGRLDGVARPRLSDLDPGEPRELRFVVEAKTTSKTLDDYEQTMRQSGQASSYIAPIERVLSGHVSGVLVDLVKKPTLRGRKDESDEEYGNRALEAYRADAGQFFRRFVIARDEARIRDVQEEFWRAAALVRFYDKAGYPRPVGGHCSRPWGQCQFVPICWHSSLSRFRHRQADKTEVEFVEPTE